MTASPEILDELRKSSLAVEARACLAALAEGEGGASFRSLYDGTLWTGSMAAFPDWPGKTGPTGKPTHAAGAWQDQPATYHDVAAITGDASFEPSSQVKNNWALAIHDFKANSGGGDLLATLQAGPSNLSAVQQGLVTTWPGGADAGFAARYADNLAALSASPAPQPSPPPSPPPPTSMQSDVVIDLSHWEAPVDFAAIKAAGIEAIILKCTQGTTFVDPTFVARAIDAAAAGLLVGAYHFFTAEDAVRQVDWFLQHAGMIPVMVLDFEPDPTNAALEAAASVMAADLHTRTGRWPLLYTGRWNVPASDPTLANCPLWLAEWGSNPVLPPGFSAWTFWQYTATGTVAGVPGACDRSRFAGTIGELHDWWHQAAPGSGILTTLVKALQASTATLTTQLASATADLAAATDSDAKITAQLQMLAAALPVAS